MQYPDDISISSAWKRPLLVCLILLCHGILLSQNKTDSNHRQTFSGPYFLKMDTVISVRLNFNNEYDQFILRGDNLTYDIRPVIFVSNRLSVNYRYISVGAGFSLHFLPGNDGNEQQGRTRSFYLRVNLFLKNWFQELQYGKVTGFYLYNTGDLDTGWEKGTDPYIQFPGLKVYMVMGATSYKLNSHFSVKALISQNEIQTRSCGSFIPSLSYSFYRIDNTDEDEYIDIRQRTDTYNAVLNAGYNYTFVFSRHFYASAGIAPGIGISYSHLVHYYQEGNVDRKLWAPVYRFQERIEAGYNSRKFFGGFDISLTQWIKYQKSGVYELNASRNYFQVFVGYRFRAPSFVRKNTNLIQDKIPVINVLSPDPSGTDKK